MLAGFPCRPWGFVFLVSDTGRAVPAGAAVGVGSSWTTRPVGVMISRCTSPPGVVTRARMGRPLPRACAAASVHDLPLRVPAGDGGGDAADGDGRRVGQARQDHRPLRGHRIQLAVQPGGRGGFHGQLQYRYIEGS